MRREGEPVFEHDFPAGTDMVKEIGEGPYAKERLEMELSARLGRTGYIWNQQTFHLFLAQSMTINKP
jgi:hypothetical protein